MNPSHSLNQNHLNYPQHYQRIQQPPAPAQPALQIQSRIGVSDSSTSYDGMGEPQHHAQHYAPYHPQQRHPQRPAQYNSHGQQYQPQQGYTQHQPQHHEQYFSRRHSTRYYTPSSRQLYHSQEQYPQSRFQQQNAPQYPQKAANSPELSLEQRQQALPPYDATHKHHPNTYSTQQEPQRSFTHFDTSTEASSQLLTSTPWAERKTSFRDVLPHPDIQYPSQPQVEYPAVPLSRSANLPEQNADIKDETVQDKIIPSTRVPQPPANQMSSVVVSRVLAQNEGQNKQASGFPNAGYKDARPNGKMLKHPDGRACYDCGASESHTQWRQGTGGPRTLCNKCGVRWASGKKRESGSQYSGGPALGAGTDSRQEVQGQRLPSIKELDLPQMQGVIKHFQTEAVQSDYRGSKRDSHGRTLLPFKSTGHNPLAQNSHSKSLHDAVPGDSTPEITTINSYKHPQPFAAPFPPNRMPNYVASTTRGHPFQGTGFSELQDNLFHDIMGKYAEYRQESEDKLVNVHKPLLLRHQQDTTPLDIHTVLLGDCLVESFLTTGARTTLGSMSLASPVPEAFNAGVSGDKIGNVLFRLENGMYDLLKGRSIRSWIILAGTNDMTQEEGLSAEDWKKFRLLLWAMLRLDRGVGSIFVCGVFGRSDLAYEVTKKVNQGICDMVCDFNDWIKNREKEYRSIVFVPPPGGINRANMYDTCRPDADGYKIWDQVLCQEISSRREIIEKDQWERDRERSMWHARRNVSKNE